MTISFGRQRAALCTVALSAVLAACGGGGGSDEPTQNLAVTFSYDLNNPSYALWLPMQQQPTLLGLEGHTPTCRLTGGRLPAGVALETSTCALSGVPNEVGRFDFTVELTVAGFAGSVSASAGLGVGGPGLHYPDSALESELPWRQFSSSAPAWIGYQPQPGEVSNFRAVDSSLPTGLQVDPDTGVVSGEFIGLGVGRFQVGATVTHNGTTVDVVTDIMEPISYVPDVRYMDPSPTARVGVPFVSARPRFNDNSAITAPYHVHFEVALDGQSTCTPGSALPAGLTLNASTGVVSGTPTQAFNGCVALRYYLTMDGATDNTIGYLRAPGSTVLP